MPHREKLRRHMEEVPHIAAAGPDAEASEQLHLIDGPHPAHDQLNKAHDDQQREHRAQPGRAASAQHPVKEDARGRGEQEPRERDDQACRRHKDKGGLCPLQIVLHVGEYRFRPAGGFKILAGRKQQAEAGIALAKRLHGQLYAAPGRVVDIDGPAPAPADHHKMGRAPVGDAGKGRVFKKLLRVIAVALGVQAEEPRGFGKRGHLCPEPGDPAELAHLRQGHPLPVIRQHHGEGGGAALHALDLHDKRHVRHTFAFRGAHVFLHRVTLPAYGGRTGRPSSAKTSPYTGRPPADRRPEPCRSGRPSAAGAGAHREARRGSAFPARLP